VKPAGMERSMSSVKALAPVWRLRKRAAIAGERDVSWLVDGMAIDFDILGSGLSRSRLSIRS